MSQTQTPDEALTRWAADALARAAEAEAGGTGPLSRPVLFTEDIAELMQVTPGTVRWWASVGRGPKSSRPGGSKRRIYLAEDVRAWLASGAA